MIVWKIIFSFLCLYLQLKLLKTFIFRLEFKKILRNFLRKCLKANLKVFLVPNFELGEKIGKAVTK